MHVWLWLRPNYSLKKIRFFYYFYFLSLHWDPPFYSFSHFRVCRILVINSRLVILTTFQFHIISNSLLSTLSEFIRTHQLYRHLGPVRLSIWPTATASNCSQLLSTASNCSQLLTIAYNCSQPLPTAHNRSQLFLITFDCSQTVSQMLTTAHNWLQLLTTAFNCSRLLSTAHNRSQLLTTANRSLQLFKRTGPK